VRWQKRGLVHDNDDDQSHDDHHDHDHHDKKAQVQPALLSGLTAGSKRIDLIQAALSPGARPRS